MSPQVIIGLIVIGIVCISGVVKFFKSSKELQIANVKEWLKYAVTLAEKDFGSGTGQLKLRVVYNSACAQFPWIGKTISFEVFSSWVDEALGWLNHQIDTNLNMKNLVK